MKSISHLTIRFLAALLLLPAFAGTHTEGGGELVQSVPFGSAAHAPQVAAASGYAFAGSSLDPATHPITADTTFVGVVTATEPCFDITIADEYQTKVEIEPIAVRCVHGEEATIKVTGLPTGLRFTAKPVTAKKTETVGGKRVTTLVTNAPANSIYGTPTKSGVYAATFTATVTEKVGKKTVTSTLATTNLTFVVIDRAKNETVVWTAVAFVDTAACVDTATRVDTAMCGSCWHSYFAYSDNVTVFASTVPGKDAASTLVVPGKTTGQGVYAAGKKVTLKATANKGYVFSGWWCGAGGVTGSAFEPCEQIYGFASDTLPFGIESGADGGQGLTALPAGLAAQPVSRLASLALVVPESDVTYEARFVTAEDDAASIRASVDGVALFSDEAITPAGTPWPLTVATNVSVGVYLEWPVAADALSAVTVAVSGLPSGLKFTSKPITQTVTVGGVRTVVTNVPANTIYGTPTAASKVDRYGEVVPSEVKVTVTTAGKAKAVGVVELTVEALPEALVGTYVGGAGGTEAEGSSSDGSGLEAASPVGSATVTLAKTGKISGKWISEGKTWTLSATGFAAVFDGGQGLTALPAGDGGQGLTALPAGRVFVATVTFKCGKETETHLLAFAVNDLGYGKVVALVDAASLPRQNEERAMWPLDGEDAASVQETEPWWVYATTQNFMYDVYASFFQNVVAEALLVTAQNSASTLGSAYTLFSATYVPWKTDAELKELAKELKGEKFTVATDDGVTLTGTVGASGVVSVKGMFDVGALRPYTATASGTLVPLDEERERFELFVYYPPVKNKFDGYAVRLVLTWDGEELRP